MQPTPSRKIFQISDAEELLKIGRDPGFPLYRNYILKDNIDLKDVNFTPIGTFADPFTGRFDGDGFVIANLTISMNSSAGRAGLFGHVGIGGRVMNLGVINADIRAGFNAGAIAGASDGTVSGCYSTGTIEATRPQSSNAGGLVGNNGGKIEKSLSSANVMGTENVGGLAGFDIVTSTPYNVIGKDAAGKVVKPADIEISFWDAEASSIPTSAGSGTRGAKTTFEITRRATFEDAGWDFREDSTWVISEGTGAPQINIPTIPLYTVKYTAGENGRLKIPTSTNYVQNVEMILAGGARGIEVTAVPDSGYWFSEWSDGDTSSTRSDIALMEDLTVTARFVNTNDTIIDVGGVIMIYTLDDLNKIGRDPAFPLDADYALANDIDASASREMNDGDGFDPIGWNESGRNSTPFYFTGTFDGRRHVISNLYINRRGVHGRSYNIGLFAWIETGGRISELGLVNIDIIALDSDRVGALAGVNRGTTINCYSTGTIVGNTTVGGLVGSNNIMKNSYSTATVSGYRNVGGLIGGGSVIEDCYFTGHVSISLNHAGVENFGGLTGVSSANVRIKNSYSAAVTRITIAGGLAGGGTYSYSYNPSQVINSYWDIETTNLSGSFGSRTGGVGLTTAQMRQQSSYIDWDFDTIWAINSAINNGYPYLRDNPPSSNPSSPDAAPALAKPRAASFTAGPNPINSNSSLNFYWNGGAIKSGKLSVYNSSGSLVSKINIKDISNLSKSNSLSSSSTSSSSSSSINLNRQIGSWNITDRRSRKLSSGSYLLRGVIVLDDGSKERVSLIIVIR